MTGKRDSGNAKKPQYGQFVEAARELGCDDDPAHFDEILKRVARHKPEAPQPEEPQPNSDSEKKSKRLTEKEVG